jgi:hypothetical protein
VVLQMVGCNNAMMLLAWERLGSGLWGSKRWGDGVRGGCTTEWLGGQQTRCLGIMSQGFWPGLGQAPLGQYGHTERRDSGWAQGARESVTPGLVC